MHKKYYIMSTESSEELLISFFNKNTMKTILSARGKQ